MAKIAVRMVQNYRRLLPCMLPFIAYFCSRPVPMSTPQHQLSSLTDAVNRLLDAHAVLKERNHELQWTRLEDAEDALTKARHRTAQLHNLSTPTPPSPALCA